MAAIPTAAALATSLRNVSDLWKEALLYGGSNAENLAAHADTIESTANWPGGSPLGQNAMGFRFGLSRAIQGGMAADYDVIFEGYRKLLVPEIASIDLAWEKIFERFATIPAKVKSRGVTFDTSVATTGTGNPTWRRLTTDKDGYSIETVNADDIIIECTADQLTGTEPGQEQFVLRQPQALDLFSLTVSGEEDGGAEPVTYTLVNQDNFGLSDLSMEGNGAADASPTTLYAWTSSVTVNSTNYAFIADGVRQSVRERAGGSLVCLEFKTSSSIYQAISSVPIGDPCDWGFWIKRKSSATGDVTMTVGSNATATVSIASLTNDVWTFVGATLNENLWPENFTAATPRLTIAVATLATGTVYIDAVKIQQMTYFNGAFVSGLPNTTDALVGYTGTLNDTVSSDSVINRQLSLSYGTRRRTNRGVGRYLPHTPNATEITASGGRTLTFAEVGGSGDTITASSGSFISDGYKVGMVVTIAGSASNNITTGPIASLTATVLTFGSDTDFANEGPVSATTTLNATPSITDP